MSFPAFKEWSVIVEALGAGEQILILRKGGIAEGRGGFQINASRFWLFPTRFHQQLEKTKPAAGRFVPPATGSAGVPPVSESSESVRHGSIELRYFADVVHSAFLSNWTAVSHLDSHHFWTEATVRERFDWSKPAGLHALVVRVHQLAQPLSLPLTSEMSGCKSWIELPSSFDTTPSVPVLSDSTFTARRAALSL